MKRVLLLSAGSPCRAIMAEAILKKYTNEVDDIEFIGAGLERNEHINESAIEVLKEEGIDISNLTPKVLDDVVEDSFDLVLTICSHSREICPKFPRRVPTIHMEFPIIENENKETCKELAQRLKTKVKPIILKSTECS